MAERLMTVGDAVRIVSREPMMDQEAQARMESEGPAGRVYQPVTERQQRAFAMAMGRSVLDNAVGPANGKAAELMKQRGAQAPAPKGNGRA